MSHKKVQKGATRLKALTLSPLTPEQALAAALRTPLPAEMKQAEQGAKQKKATRKKGR
jgi:hypothetical protein